MRDKGRSLGVIPSLASILRIALWLTPMDAHTDTFQGVAYDPETDELVIRVIYRGTNPDHQFSLVWGPCEARGADEHQVSGELLDNQARDAARQDFQKTVRISIADLDCRPATVTVRTAPRFEFTLQVPAATTKR